MVSFQLNTGINKVLNMLLDCYLHNKSFLKTFYFLFNFPWCTTLQWIVQHKVWFHFIVKKQNVYELPREHRKGIFEVCPFKRILTSIILEWVTMVIVWKSNASAFQLDIFLWKCGRFPLCSALRANCLAFCFLSLRLCATCLKRICVTFQHGTVWTDRPSLGRGCRLFV